MIRVNIKQITTKIRAITKCKYHAIFIDFTCMCPDAQNGIQVSNLKMPEKLFNIIESMGLAGNAFGSRTM